MATGTPFHASVSLRDPGWIVAGGIVLMPLMSYTQLLDFKLMPRALLLAAGTTILLLMMIQHIFRKNDAPPYPIRWHIIIPLLLLVAAYALSSLHAINGVEATFWIQKQMLFLLFAAVMLVMISMNKVNLVTLSAGVAASVAIALLLFVRELSSFDFTINTLHDLSTPFGHKNLYAAWLVLSIPFLLYLQHRLRPGIGRTALLVICATVPVTIVLLQAKAATIAMVVMALFFGVTVLSKRPRKQQIATSASAIILLMIGIVAIISLEGRLFTLQTGSFTERMIVWGNTWQMIGDYPLWGVGGGNWQIHFPKYGLHNFYGLNERVYLGYETFQRPHNDFLWVYAEAGIAGLLAWLMIPAITFWHFLKSRAWRKNRFDKQVLMSGAVIAFFVMALADFPLERFELMMMLVLCYLFAVIPENAHRTKIAGSRWIKPVAPIALLLSGYLVYTLFIRTEAEHKHYKVLETHSAGDWLRMSKLASATNERVFNIDNFSIPVQWYAGVAQSAMGNTPAAHHHFQQAYKVNPWQVHVLNNLAGTCHQLGESEHALDYYLQALEIAPFHYEVLLNKSITLYNTGQTDEAFHTMLRLVYKREHQPAYHQAMPVIFNAYLEKLINSEDSAKWNHHSLNKLIGSDSLKIVLLYHHQIEGMELEGLLNGF